MSLSQIKVLTLGADSSVINKNSRLAERTIEYGNLVKRYDIIAPANKNICVELSDTVRAYGVKLIKLPLILSRFFVLLKIYGLGKKIIKKNNHNVISVQDPFELALVGWFLARKFKIGLNIQEHGDFFSLPHWRRENLINFCRYYLGCFLIKKADSVRVVSNRIKETLIAKFNINEEKIIKVPLIIDNQKNYSERLYYELKKEYKNKFVFLTLGRQEKQKNLLLLIRAFKAVADFKANTILLMVGRGSQQKKIIKLAAKLNIKNKIKFISWTDYSHSYYRAADAYVLSSNYEGWGMVIIEAINAGLPIIMTDVGCAGEVIKDNKSGIIIPIGDQKRLEEAMLKIIKDKELRKKLGENARQAVLSLPNKEETLRLYKESWDKALV